MKKIIENKKGITLISAVVTIIVLMILTGLTVTLVLGNNGILNKAQYAKQVSTNAQEETGKGLNNIYNEIEEKTNMITDESTGLKPIINKEYEYTGSVQSFTIPYSGTYKLEVWGAQGGNANIRSISIGGKGGYATGIVYMTAGQIIYISVGGQGQESIGTNLTTGGWNGGGGNYSDGGGATGGGATDIRIGGTTLSDRIIVAGGGSGAAWGNINGAPGGGITGIDGTSWNGYAYGIGGTQNSGGSYSGSPTGGGQHQSITDGTLGQGGRGSGSGCGGSGRRWRLLWRRRRNDFIWRWRIIIYWRCFSRIYNCGKCNNAKYRWKNRDRTFRKRICKNNTLITV